MIRTLLSLLVVLVALPASAADDPVLDADPFAIEAMLAKNPPSDRATREYLEGMKAASRLDTKAAERHLKAAWSAPHVSPDVGWRAMARAAAALLRAGRYGEAADLYDRAISQFDTTLDADTRADLEQSRGVALALRDVPPQTVKPAAGKLVLSTHMLGLTMAPASINGHMQQVVLDTGANISTLSATAAKALGVRIIARQASIGSTTQRAVATNMAVASTLTFGPVVLHNVVFMVIADEALSPLGPKSRIDAIVGFPVLSALGKITFHADYGGKPPIRTLSFTPSPHRAEPGNLRFDGFNAFVKVEANGETLPFFIDSGANKTVFEKHYADTRPERLVGLKHQMAHVGGAGAVENRDAAILPAATVRIGDQTVPVEDMRIELQGVGDSSNWGTIASDVLWAEGGYTMDFGRLNLSLGK